MRPRTTARSSRLAVPALGALAAEPLYVLVDTAIVGHLGTTQLAALAIAATVARAPRSRSSTSSPTARPRRSRGCTAPGARRSRGALGVAGAVARRSRIGVVLLVAADRAARRGRCARMGGDGEVARRRDALPADRRARRAVRSCSRCAGQGYLRGIGDLRTPLVILVAAHAVNVVLELLFVYGFDWGLDGLGVGHGASPRSAWAPRSSAVQLRAPGWERPSLARDPVADARSAREIAVRTTALLGLVPASPRRVLARVGAASLGAHQIAFQLFVFLALVLDALAIAAQVMVGRMLGAGDAAGARAAALRMIGWSVARRLARVRPRPARARRRDPARLHRRPRGDRAGARDLAAVRRADAGQRRRVRARRDPHRRRRHALPGRRDGGLGRGVRAGRAAVAGGLPGVWAALLVLMGARLLTTGVRFAGRRWALVGARA